MGLSSFLSAPLRTYNADLGFWMISCRLSRIWFPCLEEGRQRLVSKELGRIIVRLGIWEVCGLGIIMMG